MKNEQENCATWLAEFYERRAAQWERVAFGVPCAKSVQYFAEADRYKALAAEQRDRAAKALQVAKGGA